MENTVFSTGLEHYFKTRRSGVSLKGLGAARRRKSPSGNQTTLLTQGRFIYGIREHDKLKSLIF
jgi:hypothetical protein